MAKQKNVLGRGLKTLLKDSILTLNQTQNNINKTQQINIENIITNPEQPRKTFNHKDIKNLSQSIKTHGIIQPIIVKKLKEKYQVIAGERRLQAAKIAKLTKVPVHIREVNDQKILEIALIENIQRVNLNPIEIATSYKRLIKECNINQEQLSQRVGKDRTTVTNHLRLLKLPNEIQIAIKNNTITMGHAKALLSITNTQEQIKLLKKIHKQQLSVRQIETIVSTTKNKQQKTTTNQKIQTINNKLSQHLKTQVNITIKTENKGEIKIAFTTLKDLNRIINILQPN